ncbi:MAG TPA: hypothetical protein PKE08_02355 [Candidatus Paceibacterota bacterium]|nr:hypothetical protein [Candidatus Paceibacterota bacterium]
MKFYDYVLWKRKYVDLWTIPHFLIGVLFAFYAIWADMPILTSFYIMTLVAVLWEIFEIKFDLHEEFTNRISDVFSSITGFYLSIVLIDFFNYLEKLLNFGF